MPHRLRAVVLLALSMWASVTWAANTPIGPADLTAEVRARIDSLAESLPIERLAAQKIDFHGNVVAWMISRTPLSPDEEVLQATATRAALLKSHQTVRTPDEALRVLGRLVDEVPPHLKPQPVRFSLTVLDVPQFNAFAIGGGELFITAPYLQSLLEAGDRGHDMLAFVLAHEIGHTALGHCRRGYQWLAIEDALKSGLERRVDRELLRKALQTTLAPAGVLGKFLYSREQEYEADLFALHLCRNAGVPEEHVLDGVRLLCLLTYPQLRTDPDFVPDPQGDRSRLAYYLSSHPNPLRRLRRLRRELSGEPDLAAGCGLLLFDAPSESFSRCADASIAAGGRAIVFVHGMEGDGSSYSLLLKRLAAAESAAGIPLLVLQYPNDQSLARSGEFLRAELKRVCGNCRNVDFVCHSAGGLVFRFYAEVRRGEFRRAVFHGTPHGGSDLARLRSLLEVSQLVGDLKLGYPESLQNSLRDGHGQITHDLHPDSLFLRYLDRHDRPADRYYVFRGRVLRTAQAAALRVTVATSRELLRREIAREIESPFLRRAADHYANQLSLPEEIANGDLAVSFESAALKGAAEVHDSRRSHLSLKGDPDVVRETVRIILESG